MIRVWPLVALYSISSIPALAQQLEPRAYTASPVGVNAVIWAFGNAVGDLNFDPSIPIDDGRARITTAVLGYFRSLDVAGKSGSISVGMPYALGRLEGNYLGTFQTANRSGLGDINVRFATILKGAPSMRLKEFVSYRQRTNVGLSVTTTAPTGQYDPARLVNVGANRWGFKPEVGVSHVFPNTRLVLDAYAGVWLYTPNNNLQGRRRTQRPIAGGQFHLSYDVRPRLWVALDGTIYRGGRTAVDGISRSDLQSNSRIGGTVSVPLTRRQSVKFAYSFGVFTTIGGNFQTVSFAYQYLWGAGM